MKKWVLGLLATSVLIGGYWCVAKAWYKPNDTQAMIQAFAQQDITLTAEQAQQLEGDIAIGINEIKANPGGNSKIHFTAVEIADTLHLNPQADRSLVKRITAALATLAQADWERPIHPVPLSWETYFNQTLALNRDTNFLNLLAEKDFHPVKISWEDIGRYSNSVWGDRISDVGIWVRQDESNPQSAQLALSVRKDSNYRDNVLMVPAEKIKIHLKNGTRTEEVSLPERLKQLGLNSPLRDKHVIVSNQFSVVPVPAKSMLPGFHSHPPRSAFNFSIYPYGSTNFVITDVIEGSSNAIVGPGQHQLLYANINGQKAPFTASRAEDRADLLKLEADLKAQGMDADVQRYYLIQIPLKKEANGISVSNMGTPPMPRLYDDALESAAEAPASDSAVGGAMPVMAKAKRTEPGLNKVAIGHGEVEGNYFAGSGYQGQRADEPIRVTVVYFVTPVGQVTESDMETFRQAFDRWDKQAIWGGSFVVN